MLVSVAPPPKVGVAIIGCSEVVICLRRFLNQISSKVATLNSYVECSKFPNVMFFFALDRQVIERMLNLINLDKKDATLVF